MSRLDAGLPAGTLTPDVPLTLAHLRPVVAVVGDVMLDGWWRGRSERISREAPAPVVEITDREEAPGGAANTAMNLAALGADVRLVGVTGPDEAGTRLVELLTRAEVDVRGLLRPDGVRTVTKTRVLSGDQMVVRIDDPHPGGLPDSVTAALTRAIVGALDGADALIVCDYDSGALREPVTAALTETGRPDLLVVDAHQLGPWADLAPDLVTPNAAEAAALLGRPLRDDGTRVATATAALSELRARSGAESVVVTLDRDGTVSTGLDGRPHRTSAQTRSERQASGAGDTFVAALTLARACAVPLPQAADFAQAAADVAVGYVGTSVCRTADLVEHLGRFGDPALDAATLARRVREHRARGHRIVMTNGCFDVLHRGHTTYLAQAARLGDVLIVAVNSDDSVRRLKGPDRPINPAADRAGVLAALSCVSYVTVFDTDTPIPLLELLRPDVYVKGGDYTPEMLAEADVVRGFGGEVRMLDYVGALSTSAVVHRIRSATSTSSATSTTSATSATSTTEGPP